MKQLTGSAGSGIDLPSSGTGLVICTHFHIHISLSVFRKGQVEMLSTCDVMANRYRHGLRQLVTDYQMVFSHSMLGSVPPVGSS